MPRPEVLVFVDWYKPGFKGGGPIRSMMNLVDHLGDRVHFHFVTSDTDYATTTPYADVPTDRWVDLPTGERVWYASSAGRSRKVWRRLVREKRWHAIYVNGMFSWWYSILPVWLAQGTGLRRIVAPRGMLLPGPMGQGPLKKQLFLALARGTGMYHGVEFHATSSEETTSIRGTLQRNARVHEAANLPRRMPSSELVPRPKVVGEVRLLNVVRIATEKNIHRIIQVLQQVQGRVSFDLYGPVHHEAYWTQCQEAIARLPQHVRFNYHGPVASEEVPHLMSHPYHALFMPNEGDNFGHTMLEALSVGLPLLISDRTPWRDLRAQQAGWDLSLDSDAPFVSALQELIDMDQQAFDRLSTGARAIGARTLQDALPVARTAELFGV